MKTFLLFFTSVLALAVAARVPELIDQLPVLEFTDDAEPDGIILTKEIAIEGRSLSSKGKYRLENFLHRLPCGWPEAGIPPLAPYTKEEIVYEIKESFAEFLGKLEHFRIDGLDIMLINKLKISYTLSKHVKFNFTFPKIVISGKYFTDAFIDMMKEYGISVRYDGKGDFEFILEDITFQGYFKYKMPVVFGSIKIYKFSGSITLGGVVSRIDGLLPAGKYNQLLNDKVGEILMELVNSKQEEISAKLKNSLVPLVNEKLKGKKIWSVIASAFGGKGKICYPPADPWA